jgi:hypothetical protein
MAKRNFATYLIGMVVAIMAVCMISSCTDQHDETVIAATKKAPANRWASYAFKQSCDPKDDAFVHTGKSSIQIFVDGSNEPEKTMEKTLKSICNIDRTPDTIRVEEGWTTKQTNVSIARSFKANKENDEVRISVSDGRTLVLPYSAEHANDEYMNVVYDHGYDSLEIARMLDNVEQTPITTGAGAPDGQYIKAAYNTTYSVEVTTGAYDGSGKRVDGHKDVLKTSAVTLVLANNSSTKTITETGEKVINEKQQQDSVVVKISWPDGHSERMVFNTILNRYIKSIERRELFVDDFDEKSFASSFSRVEKEEKVVRKDDNWIIYGREIVISKMVSVNGHVEEVTYTLYQERAEFSYKGLSHSFSYVNWTVNNYTDNFKPSMISSMGGYDELDYRNEIRTDYLGYVQFSNETIAWFKKAVELVDYEAINTQRIDYATYTFVTLDKIAKYSDGSEKKLGTYSAKLPINVLPLTNWVLNETVWGVYTSGDLVTSMASKTAEEADKFFSYTRYVYNFSNDVKGQLNKGQVSLPNDIIFDDGDVRYVFANSDLKVEKSGENTKLSSDDAEKTSYAYACVASITFGDASQEVTLPGTINITKEHDHGKVVATFMTSTPNEDRSYWKNVAVIKFEDGYHMIGLADNNDMSFDFSMTSYNDVNSAVYANGQWIPSKAEDSETSRCMIWRDENNAPKRTLDFITATRNAWNNGHNTVSDIRREGKISDGGYTVTFYLNGIAGQKLSF